MVHEKLTSITDTHTKFLKIWDPRITYNNHLNLDYSLLSYDRWDEYPLYHIMGWPAQNSLTPLSPQASFPHPSHFFLVWTLDGYYAHFTLLSPPSLLSCVLEYPILSNALIKAYSLIGSVTNGASPSLHYS